jgi:hypothetical protein
MSGTSWDREILRQSLAAGRDCPPIEKLESLLAQDASSVELARHVETCAHCLTELDLLRSFQTGPRDQEEADAVHLIESRLRPVLDARIPVETSMPWWKQLFTVRWLGPVAIAAACALTAIAIGVQLRHQPEPTLTALNRTGGEVLRSGSVSLIAPLGDVAEVPKTVQWQPVAGAAQYEVRLLEVDRTELWRTTVSSTEAGIPRQTQLSIAPAKTLLLVVTAMDSSGRKLGESQPSAFRLLQKVYKR